MMLGVRPNGGCFRHEAGRGTTRNGSCTTLQSQCPPLCGCVGGWLDNRMVLLSSCWRPIGSTGLKPSLVAKTNRGLQKESWTVCSSSAEWRTPSALTVDEQQNQESAQCAQCTEMPSREAIKPVRYCLAGCADSSGCSGCGGCGGCGGSVGSVGRGDDDVEDEDKRRGRRRLG
ncbi:unnamed protein product [Protopolystoma xenopodis]|uniref:Uncharacterized protein n=1 Tax=Protopolystoma xenopodis TaxID=117903 RepID=A0A3S5C722_9PLAT|nr:unnamed protein product [Protopolystoma xenopodis]